MSILRKDLFMIMWAIMSFGFIQLFDSNEYILIILFVLNCITLGMYAFSTSYKSIIKEKRYSLTIFFVLFQFGIQASFGCVSLLLGTQRSNSGWYYMNESLLISVVGCICVMFATRNKKNVDLGIRIRRKFSISRKNNCTISIGIAVILFIISTFVFLLCMQLGIYGYADNSNLLGYSSYASIAQYIIYIADFGSLIAYMCYFVSIRDNNKTLNIVAFVFIAVRIILALLSGMKKELIAIFVCLFFIKFIVKKKVSLKNILLIVVAISVGYFIIEMYRSMLRGNDFTGGSRFALLMQAAANNSVADSESGDVIFKLLSRLNIIEPCSKIVYFKKEIGLASGDPNFLLDLILLPLTIFIPRFLIPFKSSSGSYGLWVTHRVMGMPESILSSSYVTVQGCFYLAGGMLCVIIGFLIVGCILEVVSGFLDDFSNPALLGTFMMIMYKAILEPATPTGMITLIIRGVIIYSFFGVLVLKRKKDVYY